MTSTGTYKTKLKLPQGLRCNHCIVQWNYRAGFVKFYNMYQTYVFLNNYLIGSVVGNNWGYCDNGTSGLGCGPQETFRGCADITIQ